jgi:uncharacterized membrane protein
VVAAVASSVMTMMTIKARAKEKEVTARAKEKEATARAKEKEAMARAKEKEATARVKAKEVMARARAKVRIGRYFLYIVNIHLLPHKFFRCVKEKEAVGVMVMMP